MKFFRKKSNDSSLVQSAATNTHLYFKVFHLSETGPSRQSNEDTILFVFPEGPRSILALVADGMGGHNAGEIASDLACSTAEHFILSHFHDNDAKKILKDLIVEANQSILAAAASNPSYSGMGTTATTLFIRDDLMYYAQVGDSRLYFCRDHELKQCTTDQTLVNQMLQEGKISSQEAQHHSMKNVLVQALGSNLHVEPEISKTGMPVKLGDRFFLCSDGIYDFLQFDELKALLSMNSGEFIIECIKALGMQRMASDNFSAILVEVTDEQPPERISDNHIPATKEQNVLI